MTFEKKYGIICPQDADGLKRESDSNMKKLVFLLLSIVILTCLVACNNQKPQDPTPEHTHSFGEWSVTNNATCTENGVKTRYCDCGEKQSDAIPATGHEKQILPAIEATCTKTGLTEGSQCPNCNKILVGQAQIPMIAHVYDNNDDVKCNTCGFERVLYCKHDNPQMIEIVPATAATCISTGLTQGMKCALCGTMVIPQRIVPVTQCMDLKILQYVAPTCYKTGLTEGKQCNICGKIVRAQESIPLIDCIEGDWIVDLESTYTEQGKRHKVCIMCGKTLVVEVIPLLKITRTLGMGLVFGDITNTQINATIAAVVTDENGKIVSCKIDAVQNKYMLGDRVNFTLLDTKKELGFKYNMAAFGTSLVGNPTVKEWFEQAAAFEAWCVGKTIAEVVAMATQTMPNGSVISADEDLLAAGCTIQISDFIAAVVKACEDDQGMTFEIAGDIAGDITLGLGINNSDNGSFGDDFEATIKMNIDYAAVVTVDGVIVAALNDAAQPQAVLEDCYVISTAKLISKRELKEGYKMAAWGSDNNGDGIVLEWYLQSAAFSNYIVGMTAEQVKNVETAEVGGYFISTDDALLNAGCTIQITEMKAIIVKAVENAR